MNKCLFIRYGIYNHKIPKLMNKWKGTEACIYVLPLALDCIVVYCSNKHCDLLKNSGNVVRIGQLELHCFQIRYIPKLMIICSRCSVPYHWNPTPPPPLHLLSLDMAPSPLPPPYTFLFLILLFKIKSHPIPSHQFIKTISQRESTIPQALSYMFFLSPPFPNCQQKETKKFM